MSIYQPRLQAMLQSIFSPYLLGAVEILHFVPGTFDSLFGSIQTTKKLSYGFFNGDKININMEGHTKQQYWWLIVLLFKMLSLPNWGAGTAHRWSITTYGQSEQYVVNTLWEWLSALRSDIF